MPIRAAPSASSSICRIREAALSCVGCCLYAFAGKEETLAAIRRNTATFAQLVPGDEAALLRFRDRETPCDVVCRNCIEEVPDLLGCPLHPNRHASRDLRRGHCMAEFLCRTAALYRNEWSQETREWFITFVKEQRLDNYEYSRLMVSDGLLEAFLEQARSLDETPSECRRLTPTTDLALRHGPLDLGRVEDSGFEHPAVLLGGHVESE
jgi:hypothetical protein